MEKPKKNKPYMMYLKQSLAAVKPQYHAYRDGKNVVHTHRGRCDEMPLLGASGRA